LLSYQICALPNRRYSKSADLLVETHTPNMLQARDWRSWDTPPVWKASEATLSGNYNGVTVAESLVYLYDGDDGQIEALKIHTGERAWHVQSSDAKTAKNVDVVEGIDCFFHTFSFGSGDFMKVRISKLYFSAAVLPHQLSSRGALLTTCNSLSRYTRARARENCSEGHPAGHPAALLAH
jgi:hypothetical protein